MCKKITVRYKSATPEQFEEIRAFFSDKLKVELDQQDTFNYMVQKTHEQVSAILKRRKTRRKLKA